MQQPTTPTKGAASQCRTPLQMTRTRTPQSQSMHKASRRCMGKQQPPKLPSNHARRRATQHLDAPSDRSVNSPLQRCTLAHGAHRHYSRPASPLHACAYYSTILSYSCEYSCDHSTHINEKLLCGQSQLRCPRAHTLQHSQHTNIRRYTHANILWRSTQTSAWSATKHMHCSLSHAETGQRTNLAHISCGSEQLARP